MSDVHSMTALISRKKVGAEMTLDELTWLCERYLTKEIPDYQVAAWLMAVCCRGMTPRETAWLTEALVTSGLTLTWDSDRPVVDKHSTGGVGDKTSIVLVPLIAAAGFTFVKMSGRGLGHTGGTLDKLESIPGFRTAMPLNELRRQVARIGCALVGQSPELAPADGALYALRDVTATTDSLPLIASSVMAKKLAAGASAIVLDVKYGSGALMETKAEAERLAETMVEIGHGAGRRVCAVLGSMDEPLGLTVGNAPETREAIEALRGDGPPELREQVIRLGSELMVLAGAANSVAEAAAELELLLDSGAAAERFAELVEAQGGDPEVVRDPSRLPRAAHVGPVTSSMDGVVMRVDARGVAEAALLVRAGRARKGDSVDPAAGVVLRVRRGDRVTRGEMMAEVLGGSADEVAAAVLRVEQAIRLGE
jgi:pyrimidine-nucleoside phosphorylase